ncbi:MAG: PIN domain-containing protein [Chloroflexi bacterium]|nr:PIN domain-containing protein [Chloroflexota bacterium]MCL5275372.1 PIN domain-containing protein [Chloroflexota bacterium]
MPNRTKSIVLDAWAVLAFLQDEPAGKLVADIIADTHEAGGSVLMTVANAGEVWYIVSREASESDADASIADLLNIGVQLTDINWELTRIAARFKARGRLSYADAYAAALAKQSKCELVTGDPEFKALDGEIKLRWLINSN